MTFHLLCQLSDDEICWFHLFSDTKLFPFLGFCVCSSVFCSDAVTTPVKTRVSQQQSAKRKQKNDLSCSKTRLWLLTKPCIHDLNLFKITIGDFLHKTQRYSTPDRIMMLRMSQSFISPVTLQVSWPSGPPPWSSSLDLDLLHQWLRPPFLLAATPGVGVHLGGAQASFPTARRPRRTRLHQTWWSAQPDAPSGRWTPCRDLPERLIAAGSWEHLILRQWLEKSS